MSNKMKMLKWYHVMRKYYDSSSKDEGEMVSVYQNKENAFMLKDLLNKIDECDIRYFVEFDGKEIKE